MRFPDGAIRPAYNAQTAAAPKEGAIVSIELTDRRNDAGLAGPMVDDIARRYGRTPDRLLVDTSYRHSQGHRCARRSYRGSGQRLYAPAQRKGDRQAGHAGAPDPQAGERTLLPQGMAGAHGERSGPGRLCFAPAHRADQRRPQEPRLWFSPRSRAHQGEGSRALACAREQSRRRPPPEDRNPVRRSQVITPLPFATRTALTRRTSDTHLTPSKHKNAIPSHARTRA